MKTHFIWLSFLVGFLFNSGLNAQEYNPEFSTAGFFEIPNSGREVFSMNPAWRIYKGKNDNAYQKNFDDSSWKLVSLPDGIEKQPIESSGGINYQGEVWYRKHFNLNEIKNHNGKLFLHFEGIMGKSKIYVNGKLVKEHFGGFLPVIVDITNDVSKKDDNVIAVWADNSNDPDYPPGKTQELLDFTYSGGIYRDCWLIAHNDVYITDANYEDEIAGGGLFVAYKDISDKKATILLNTQIKNDSYKGFEGKIIYELYNKENKLVKKTSDKVNISNGKTFTDKSEILLKNPNLWSPDNPYLYNLIVKITDKRGKVVDGFRERIGIRSFEFKGKEGFWLNGKPYGEPLIGANRHQDFAVLGNALPNKLHWRDAKKLRDLGLKVIRNAHYPQDPAFMDACDELGLLVIVNTPGWQFWNEKPIFEQRVHSDIRNMVRRDRNHPSVWLWEPILNETWYPDDFAKRVFDIVNEEYPYPYCYSACDLPAKGSQYFPVLFTHPSSSIVKHKNYDENKTYFTREWGDNVDDWISHNSTSRVSRDWGEQPMLIQAQHYAKPKYPFTCYDLFYRLPSQHVGGCLWHSFDHQRGYHPDPFFGGIMDNFRQPKTSYYMFKSQRSPKKENRLYETGPMVYIAHDMSPFSDKNVTVYSNCDEVRLTFNKDGKTHTYTKDKNNKGMPSPIITFENVYDFMVDKKLSRKGRQDEVFLIAEGLIDGKVVATHKVSPARRPSQLLLWADTEGNSLEANGSDIVTVVAGVADENGNIKRLNDYFVRFKVEGEGELVADEKTMTNPTPVRWGTAPVLVRSTTKPGKIKITAEVLFQGSQQPQSAELVLESVSSRKPLIFSEKENKLLEGQIQKNQIKSSFESQDENQNYEEQLKKLKEVEKQQNDFGEQHN